MPPKFYKKKTNVFTMTKPDVAKYLIIVESPSKCKKIEEYLGKDYYCIATKGHIRHIENLKSIDIKDTFLTKFSILEDKKDHVEQMRKIIKQFKNEDIFLASDADREGEAISWHICQVFNLPCEITKRIIFHEVTKPALLKAIREPTFINMNLVNAQIARQVLDIIVGFTISPFLWKYLFYNKDNSLSAGRCQTPALSLIYDNFKQKEDQLANGSSSDILYKITALFTGKRLKFDLDKEFKASEQVVEFLELSKTFQHEITIGSKKISIRSPPQPFHTSRLLQVASNVLHISPKETMNLCQQLYQAGHITYMRTESSQYSQVFLDQATTYITKTYNDIHYIGNLDKLANKDATNPHEAIRVTHIETSQLPQNDENADKRLASMYKLIWKNTIESCMSDATYNTYALSITAPAIQNTETKYKCLLEIPLFLGWKKVNEINGDCSRDQASGTATLLYLQSLKSIKYELIESHITIKNRHQHYSESGLIQTLEELGIGRPSTFASIVETIIDRGYVKCSDVEGQTIKCIEYKMSQDSVIHENISEKILGSEKNKLIIQPIGILAVEFLKQYFQPIFTYEFTKNMEQQLDIISYNSLIEWSSICKECYVEIVKLSNELKKLGKQNFVLDENHSFAFEKMGPVIKESREDGTLAFLPVKQGIQINLDKLKNKQYSLDDLVESKTSSIGKYLDEDVYLKYGKFGPYVQWKETSISVKELLNENKNVSITLEKVLPLLESKIKSLADNEVTHNLLRWIRQPDLSIRKGKFGPYVFYQAKDMKKPTFFNIKKFNEGLFTCTNETLITWLNQTYKVNL
jgi:DNA topoisomerase-1